jgi:hypothetical protein
MKFFRALSTDKRNKNEIFQSALHPPRNKNEIFPSALHRQANKNGIFQSALHPQRNKNGIFQSALHRQAKQKWNFSERSTPTSETKMDFSRAHYTHGEKWNVFEHHTQIPQKSILSRATYKNEFFHERPTKMYPFPSDLQKCILSPAPHTRAETMEFFLTSLTRQTRRFRGSPPPIPQIYGLVIASPTQCEAEEICTRQRAHASCATMIS